jgi:hypothetical protein
MPFIQEYWGDDTSKEAKFVFVPRESPMPVALHETLHVVICRLDGLDIRDVVEGDEAAWTRLVDPQTFTPAALMAPEIYMTINNIAFDDLSVSNDRQAFAECFRAEAVEDIRQSKRELLELYFQCPCVRAAISILSARMNVELREHKAMNGIVIHEIIDPILKHSPYADGLRKKLKGQT